MSLRNLAILTAVVAAGAFLTLRSKNAAPQVAPPGLAFPGLKQSLNDVAGLTVLRSSGSVALTRTGTGADAKWIVPAKSGFPADLERVRSTLIQLSNLELSEPKTANPEFYTRLGVQDVSVLPADADEAAKKAAPPGALVELKDSAGKSLGSLIIGNAAETGNATLDRPMESGQFVRRPGQTQSWLTRGTIFADAEPMNWIERKIVGIPRERVQSVTIRRLVGTGPSTPSADPAPDLLVSRASKDDANFVAAGMTPGAELLPSQSIDQSVQAIAYLGMDDVMKDPGGVIGNADPAATGPDAAHPAHAVITTFDGLVLNVRTGFRDGKWWATVGAETAADPIPPAPATGAESPKPPETEKVDVKKEAAAINARTATWLFAISQFDARRLSSRLSEMLAPAKVEAAPPAIGPAARPPSGEDSTPLPPREPEFPAPVPK